MIEKTKNENPRIKKSQNENLRIKKSQNGKSETNYTLVSFRLENLTTPSLEWFTLCKQVLNC